MSDLKAKIQEKAVATAQGSLAVVTPQKEMEGLLKGMQKEIERAVSGLVTPERFGRIALSVWNGNNAFWKCSRISFLSSLMKAAQAGLEPNTVLGEAYLIPYGQEVSFQMGYKGILTLCHRSKMYKSIYSHEVYKNDKFEYAYGLDKKLIHVPADVPEGEPTYYYAVYRTLDDGTDFVVWSRDRVIKHAQKFSKTYNNPKSPWQTSFSAMAKKTVLLDVLKYAPKSVEMAKAAAMDESQGDTEKLDSSFTDVDFIDIASEVAGAGQETEEQGVL